MKKQLKTLMLAFLPVAAGASGKYVKAEYLGLMSELSQIKSTSELLLSDILNSSSNSDALKRAAVEKYNDLKTVDEQFIEQLSADSKQKNSLCYYKELDKMLTCKTMRDVKKDYYNKRHYYKSAKIEAYVHNLVLMSKLHKDLMQLKDEAVQDYSGTQKGMEVPTDPALTLAAAMWKNAQDNREEKVEALTHMLEANKLCAADKLIKPEPKPEKTVVLAEVKTYEPQATTQVKRYAKRHKHYKGKTCKCK